MNIPGDPQRDAPARVRVKVCGITSVDQALACAELGVDWIGLNFHPASPRKVDPRTAAEIVTSLPDSCTAVGLFVDRPPGEVLATANEVGLKTLQLHGTEPPEDLAALGFFSIVRAFRLGEMAAISAMTEYLDRALALGHPPYAALIDGYSVGQAGGTGKTIATDLLDHLPPLPRLILAGGLTPENVAGRIARVRPWMVDVASGVESSPGRKDLGLVRAFVRAAQGVP